MSLDIIDSLSFFFVIIGSVFMILAIRSKSILKKQGFNTNYFIVSFSDIANLKRLSKLKPEFRLLYISLLFFTFLLALLVLLLIVSEMLGIFMY